MEWIQLILVLATFVTLFTWNRTESRTDARQMQQQIEANRKETQALIEAIREDVKDFHSRLCIIEDRNRREK